MDILLNIDWSKWWAESASFAGTIIRGTMLYCFLLFAVRLILFQNIFKIGITNIIIVVIITDAVTDIMTGQRTSIVYEVVLVVTLIGWHALSRWVAQSLTRIRRGENK